MLPSVGTWMVPSFRAPVAPVPAVSCQHCMVSDDPCTCSGLSLHRLETIFVHAIHCAASFYLRHGSKIVRTICRGSSYLIKTLAYLVLAMRWLWAMLLHFFCSAYPGAIITSLHFSHGHILVTWELDAGVYLGVCWICSERRSSCNVKAKALRASQLKDVKGKNLGDFWHQGSGLFFQGTGSSASQRVGVHKQLICNQTSLVNRNMWAIVSLFVDLWWFMSEEFRAKEMNTIDCQTHRA